MQVHKQLQARNNQETLKIDWRFFLKKVLARRPDLCLFSSELEAKRESSATPGLSNAPLGGRAALSGGSEGAAAIMGRVHRGAIVEQHRLSSTTVASGSHVLAVRISPGSTKPQFGGWEWTERQGSLALSRTPHPPPRTLLPSLCGGWPQSESALPAAPCRSLPLPANLCHSLPLPAAAAHCQRRPTH